ncbi:MAG: cbb3-type cytochrome c oxidase subunit 3 [Gammaproteobacteria bacterium]|nr:cbb3-type cytochrome c oxidase subunit 3 [Gammaproteobacteria bacterium]
MRPGTLHGLWTLLALLAFIGVSAWAWSARRRGRFEAAARMPLEDDVSRNEGP